MQPMTDAVSRSDFARPRPLAAAAASDSTPAALPPSAAALRGQSVMPSYYYAHPSHLSSPNAARAMTTKEHSPVMTTFVDEQVRFPIQSHASHLSISSSSGPLQSSPILQQYHPSRPQSVSTLWSSADVPLFLDSNMERSGSNASQFATAGPSKVFMSIPKGTMTVGLERQSSVSSYGLTMPDHEERDEGTKDSTDGPRSVSSPLSSDYSDYHQMRLVVAPTTPSTTQKTKPSRLSPSPFRRDLLDPGMPVSVSHGSHLTMATQRSTDSSGTLKPIVANSAPPAINLYQEAEKYFDRSYSMTPTPPNSAALPSTTVDGLCEDDGLLFQASSHLLQSRFSDAETEDGTVNVVSPPYSRSRDSKSSADTTLTMPEFEEGGNARIQTSNRASFTPSSLTKSVLNDGSPSSPLRAAIGLTANHSMPRPSTSDATSIVSPSKSRPLVRHVHTSSDQELLRRMKNPTTRNVLDEVDQSKYDFLDSPAPTPMPKKMTLFGSKLRAVSTPRLRAAKLQEQSSDPRGSPNGSVKELRPYPPPAPSGRFRSRTLGEADQSATATLSPPATAAEEETARRPRRPSSTEALVAAARRLRRPSKAGTMSSSHYNSSVTSFNNQSDVYGTPTSAATHTTSSTSSQGNLESGNRSTSTTNGTHKKPTLRAHSSQGRPKSKGGWASHLSQGLSLHIEQGSRRYVIKMDYLSYDPFGKAESLCAVEDRPSTPRRPKSKGGLGERESSSSEDQTGLLEFAPRVETAEGSSTRLTLASSLEEDAHAPILKHLVIGDDVKADLITRQANLSMSSVGTREVSGSERKGKVAWRFIYGVEECWNASGQVLGGVKTLRPIGFSCSATLLDPSRARKSRVITMIRKQMGSHIESMPMAGSSLSSGSGTLPKIESPTSSQSGSQGQSPVPAPSPTPPRPGLVPFKMSRPMLEAMTARNRKGSEQSSSGGTSVILSSPIGASSHLTRKSSLLPSPLSSHFTTNPQREGHSPGAKSARDLPTFDRLLTPQAAATTSATTRQRGNSMGQSDRRPTEGALGLDTNEEPTPRRNRAVTAHVDLNRPTTASEEIKQAYLMQASHSDHSLTSAANPIRQPQYTEHHQQQFNNPLLHHAWPLYSQNDQRFDNSRLAQNSARHHQYPHRPNTSQVDTREPIAPVTYKRQTQAAPAVNFEPPEGPYWL